MTTYGYDAVSRLTQLTQDLNGSGSDLTLDFSYNPAGEIAGTTRSNDAYSYTAHANANVADSVNGLNQVTATGGTSVSHGDGRGNVTAIGSSSYAYDSLNRMTGATGATGYLYYEPLGRLSYVYNGPSTRVRQYDGERIVLEGTASGPIERRFVFGPGMDEPLVWYEGTGLSDRRWFHADERGSVIAVSDASGDLVTSVNRYDEYGNVQGTLTGRFGYTGQEYLAGTGLYHYRARAYNPAMGRFMQTDPIGFGGGMNVYAYVGNNPVNFTDPMGLEDVEVIANPRWRPQNPPILNFMRMFAVMPSSPVTRYQEPDFSRKRGGPLPDCDPAVEDNCALVEGHRLPQPPAINLFPTSVQLSAFGQPGYCEGDTGPIYCRNVGREIGQAVEDSVNRVTRCV